MHWPISFERPEWLWLLLAIPLIVAISFRSFAGLDRWRRVVVLVLRSLVLCALAAALARIQFVKEHDNVAVLFLVDRSRSIPPQMRLDAQEWVREAAGDIGPEDLAGLISFDGRADLDLVPSGKADELIDFSLAEEAHRTNLAEAMRLAMASFPDGYARRVVLLSDGNENVGDFTEEIRTAAANGVAIDVLPLQYQHEQEVLFDRIAVPTQTSGDVRVPVRMIVKSRHPTRVKLDFYCNDVPVDLDQTVFTIPGGLQPFPIECSVPVGDNFLQRFDARLTPIPPSADSIAENNRATAFTFTEQQGKVLLLTQADSADEIVLKQALEDVDSDSNRSPVNVDLLSVNEFDVDLARLLQYSAVILSNVPADDFTREQHQELASYVKDQGGGLIMIGGDDSFGAGGWIGTPIEEVSPVSFEVKHKKVMPRGALAIVMHSCEIPKGNYWGEQVAIAAVNAISSRDYLGVICFSPSKGGPNWDVPLAPAANKPAIINKIKQMQIGDMPDFATTMEIAVKDLLALKDASQRHMIIISDGDPSPPTQATISKMQKNKITCSTVGIGFGMHVTEKTLQDIARATNPRGLKAYYPVKNPKRLPQIFVKEAKVIKRPLIWDEPFLPRFVGFSSVLEGISGGSLPQLGGLVLTQRKEEALMPIARRTTDGDDPVFAHWNYEMGKMAVYTSGMWNSWGSAWRDWEKFSKFWRQVLESVRRQAHSADFDVVTRLEGNKGRVVIEALNKDASYLNFLRILEGRVMAPGADDKPLRVTQTGPGRYEGTFDVGADGNYIVSLRYMDPSNDGPDGGPQEGVIRTGLAVPYSSEYRELEANMNLLDRARRETSGRMLAMDSDKRMVFDHNLPPLESRQPVWRWVIMWLLIPLFILDVAARRLASLLALSVYIEVAVFAIACAVCYAAEASWTWYLIAFVLAETVGWAIRVRYIVPTINFFTSSVTALSRAGERSSESLSQLKGVRDRVREDIETDRSQRPARTIELEPTADPRRRFDAGGQDGGDEAGDLVEEMGGATLEEERPTRRPGGQGDEPAEPGSLAARLRKAKQRAHDQLKDQSKDDTKGD